jgi:hypothetical protein
VSSCSFEVLWVSDHAVFAIGVDELDGTNIVVQGLVVTACTMTDGTIDASNCDSGASQSAGIVRRQRANLLHKNHIHWESPFIIRNRPPSKLLIRRRNSYSHQCLFCVACNYSRWRNKLNGLQLILWVNMFRLDAHGIWKFGHFLEIQ